MKGRGGIVSLGAAAALLLMLAGFTGGIAGSYFLTVSRYAVRTSKLQTPVRLLLITDLHSCYYGKGQSVLVQAAEACQPDAVMFCGDIADDKRPIGNAKVLLSALASRYPCFYVTGNHEHWSGRAERIKDVFRACGVTVLDGSYTSLTVRGEEIVVCGVDDPAGGEFAPQFAAAARGAKTRLFSVLLSHRPERLKQYARARFDLVLSGHAHGGQWRIPGILNGLYAPNQGFFPKYTSGAYREEATTLIVSKGLARESTRLPRFFNPVELVVVDIIRGNLD